MRAAAWATAILLATASIARAQLGANPYEGEADVEADPDVSSDTETDVDAEADPEADAEAETDAEAEAGVGPVADAEAEAETEEAEQDPASQPHWTEGRVIAWTTFTVSLVVAIGGVIILAAGVDDINAIETATDGSVWADYVDEQERAPILTGVGFAVIALGAIGTAVGAGLLAWTGEQGTWLSVSALPNGISVRGAF